MKTEAIAAIVDGSKNLVNWGLAILGGSLVVLLSTSYRRPTNWVKYFYLFFLPAWIFLACSLNCESHIIGSSIMAALHGEDSPITADIILKLNDTYKQQFDLLGASIACLGIWLTAYLLWFIFSKNNS